MIKQYCSTTNKVCYSQKEASEVITQIKNSRNHARKRSIPKRAYFCKFCHFWHLTHFNNKRTCKSTVRRYGLKC